MNRLFEDVFRGFDTPTLWGGRSASPQIEVQDADSEYRVTAAGPLAATSHLTERREWRAFHVGCPSSAD